MNKLVIVSTEIQSGRGGIQSALKAYCEGFDEINVNYELIESHNDDDLLKLKWLSSFWKIVIISVRYKNENVIFWFHSAKWLSLFRKFSLSIIAKMFGHRVVNHIHSPATANYLKNTFSRFILRILLSPFNNLVVLTPWWERKFKQYGFSQNILVSANPNSRQLFNLATKKLGKFSHTSAAIKITDEKIRILSMARLIEGKGFDLVIRAMLLLPDHFELTIAGAGPLQASLQSLCSQLKLNNRVKFLGWVEEEDKSTIFDSHHLFCLPSRYDSFGMVFIEAMANNLPVIGLHLGPMPDIITEETGLLCQSETDACVAENIQSIARNINQFHLFGPRIVLEKYRPIDAAKRIVKLFN